MWTGSPSAPVDQFRPWCCSFREGQTPLEIFGIELFGQ